MARLEGTPVFLEPSLVRSDHCPTCLAPGFITQSKTCASRWMVDMTWFPWQPTRRTDTHPPPAPSTPPPPPPAAAELQGGQLSRLTEATSADLEVGHTGRGGLGVAPTMVPWACPAVPEHEGHVWHGRPRAGRARAPHSSCHPNQLATPGQDSKEPHQPTGARSQQLSRRGVVKPSGSGR